MGKDQPGGEAGGTILAACSLQNAGAVSVAHACRQALSGRQGTDSPESELTSGLRGLPLSHTAPWQ